MNFIEAVKLLKLDDNLKAKRRKNKLFEVYFSTFQLDKSNNPLLKIRENDIFYGKTFSPTYEDITADDWYIVKYYEIKDEDIVNERKK